MVLQAIGLKIMKGTAMTFSKYKPGKAARKHPIYNFETQEEVALRMRFGNLEAHPYSKLFPLMDFVSKNELIYDIEQNGAHEDVILFENKVLVRWDYFDACMKAVKEPQLKNFDGEDPLSFVISVNLQSSKLDASQRAWAAAKLAAAPAGQ